MVYKVWHNIIIVHRACVKFTFTNQEDSEQEQEGAQKLKQTRTETHLISLVLWGLNRLSKYCTTSSNIACMYANNSQWNLVLTAGEQDWLDRLCSRFALRQQAEVTSPASTEPFPLLHIQASGPLDGCLASRWMSVSGWNIEYSDKINKMLIVAILIPNFCTGHWWLIVSSVS